MMTATYSPEDNKLRLSTVARLDSETYERVKQAGFKWAPKQQVFVAAMWTPLREDIMIELCGEIEPEETTMEERAAARAERFEGYRNNRQAAGDRAHDAVTAITEMIPLGQPILVGHHSERHARRDQERIHNGMSKAVRSWETAKYWKSRAAATRAHADYKSDPRTRANRIKTLEADLRMHERAIEKSRGIIEAWGRLDALGTDAEGFYGAEPSAELRLARAIAIANSLDYGCITQTHEHASGYVGPLTYWSALQPDMDRPPAYTPDQVREDSIRRNTNRIAYESRWTAHLTLRITYEKEMLEADGRSELIAPKPRQKSAAASLPLLNYRAADGIKVQNRYHRGETMHHQQVEMTAAEYKRISPDYKATSVAADGSHRVRCTMQRHTLVAVFLTDSKVHDKP